MKNYDFFLNKFTGYFFILLCVSAIYSCKQEVDKLTNPTPVTETEVNQLMDGLIDFIGNQDLNSTELDNNYINLLNAEAERLSGQKSDYTLAQATALKGVIIDLFEGHNMTGAIEHPWLPSDERLLSLASIYREKIVKTLGDLTNIDSIKEAIDQLRNEAQTIESFSSNDLDFVINQLNITERVITDIYVKYGNEKGVHCKWYQWICVGASTAAAIALIAVTGGAAAAIILGGGTVAIVAACCICGCRCTFTDSCQDPDPCEGVECPPGTRCEDGNCVTIVVPPNPCDGVNCPPGYECVNGDCRSLCYGVHCVQGYHCVNGECVEDPFYEGCSNSNPCPPGEQCIQGICVPW